MLSTDDACQPDLLNSIVTITDLLSHDDPGTEEEELETLGRLIEAIARLKGVLIGNENAVEQFGESGGFESLLKAVEKGSVWEDAKNDELGSEDTELPDPAANDSETPQDDRFQLRKELLQLTFAALSQV